MRIGVDVGGTFTDVVLERGADPVSTKVLTTHDAPEQGILDAIAAVTERAGVRLAEVDTIIHGTTLATNETSFRMLMARTSTSWLSAFELKTGNSDSTRWRYIHSHFRGGPATLHC